MAGTLLLKWGTVKGWNGLDDEAIDALQKFADLGMSVSAMMQEMTPEHKAALCGVIDCVDVIENDWTGEKMSRDEAKKYVMEYRS